MKRLRKIVYMVVLCGIGMPAMSQQFIHPGLLSGYNDLQRIKKALAYHDTVITAGFEELKKQPQSHYTYQLQGPLATVGRNPTVGQTTYDSDANAAFQNALMWSLTGDIRHAQKAIEIINAWSNTLTSITGRDAVLMAGLGPFKMVNAAELLRYTHSGWQPADIQRTEQHFRNVVYPVIQNCAPFANGNWDSAALKTVMAISIFCNDRVMFEQALNYYQNGVGDGRLTNYIINEAGQCQESGRDQSHTQLGIAHLADCCEMAWHQGLDLYSLNDNLLLKGFEYTAKYNLGNDVPFTPTIDRTGKYRHQKISTEARGRLRAIYEEVYNHYVHRCGLSAPFTTEAATKVRPEPQGTPGADHTGFGTLLYSGESPAVTGAGKPYQAAGLIVNYSTKGNTISWPGVINARHYVIRRANSQDGPFRILATDLSSDVFIDQAVEKGHLYYYQVAAQNENGIGVFSQTQSVSTGLPSSWKIAAIGLNLTKKKQESGDLFTTGGYQGKAIFNGTTYRIAGVGTGADSIGDKYTMLYKPLRKDGELIVRYIPQFSAQSTQLGLAIRTGLQGNAAGVSLLFRPNSSGNIEAPGWQLQLQKRTTDGQTTAIVVNEDLREPFVTFGRMTGVIWLKLNRQGKFITASYSIDGKEWRALGSTMLSVKEDVIAGLMVASGSKIINTEVNIDHLSVSNNP